MRNSILLGTYFCVRRNESAVRLKRFCELILHYSSPACLLHKHFNRYISSRLSTIILLLTDNPVVLRLFRVITSLPWVSQICVDLFSWFVCVTSAVLKAAVQTHTLVDCSTKSCSASNHWCYQFWGWKLPWNVNLCLQTSIEGTFLVNFLFCLRKMARKFSRTYRSRNVKKHRNKSARSVGRKGNLEVTEVGVRVLSFLLSQAYTREYNFRAYNGTFTIARSTKIFM